MTEYAWIIYIVSFLLLPFASAVGSDIGHIMYLLELKVTGKTDPLVDFNNEWPHVHHWRMWRDLVKWCFRI